ncbi:CPBP family intramembrane glutamic endopeptidase [Haladaptatus sp. DYSN1]|uniref:CPBP family intramembrane glutamic endopeptidase n=1 Tax=unclassified Haladaptatus TaxID=2622732 RepID=UPI002406C5E5|nr:type II CAAX endopeptidase family protein [Haladaptatus sp. DYSN1]
MTYSKQRARPLPTVAIALVVAAIGLVAGVALSLGAIVVLSALGFSLAATQLLVISLVMTQGLAFGGVALLYLRFRGLPSSFIGARIPTLGDLGWVVGGYIAAILTALLGGVLIVLTGVQAASNQAAEFGIENPEALLLLIPASFLLIGPGEELLFRGVVQGTIRKALGPVPGVVLASAVFAAIHFFALTGGASARFVSIGILFLPALVFGFAYERTGNIVVPSLIHGTYNATLFSLLYLSLQFG